MLRVRVRTHTRAMSARQIHQRCRLKPGAKAVNFLTCEDVLLYEYSVLFARTRHPLPGILYSLIHQPFTSQLQVVLLHRRTAWGCVCRTAA